MGYFEMTVHFDQDVEVELDTDEVLGNMHNGDILDYVQNSMDSGDILNHVVENRDVSDILDALSMNDIVEYVVNRHGNATLLRKIADRLDQQDAV